VRIASEVVDNTNELSFGEGQAAEAYRRTLALAIGLIEQDSPNRRLAEREGQIFVSGRSLERFRPRFASCSAKKEKDRIRASRSGKYPNG